jgi:hypothetical protein
LFVAVYGLRLRFQGLYNRQHIFWGRRFVAVVAADGRGQVKYAFGLGMVDLITYKDLEDLGSWVCSDHNQS